MKNKINIRNITIAFLFLILIILAATIVSQTSKQITELTQFRDNSSRQMMGYILKTNNNKLIVIDGGTTEDSDNLTEYIKENGSVVEYWFITHAHDDHAGAFTKIVEDKSIKINSIYISLNEEEWYDKNDPKRSDFAKELINVLSEENLKNKVHSPSINEKITIDNINAEILGIRNPEITENAGNEQSLVIRFDTEKTSLLILGDTGVKSSEKLLNTQKEKLDCDIVQMAHHGQNGATKELYEAISPKICLWPTPEWLWDNNPGTGYNTGVWKTIETREWMNELGVKQHYVEKDGDITIEI